MSTPIDQIRDAAIRIAEEASAVPMSYFRASFTVDSKADESPVTIADRETEAFIRKALGESFPGHGILGEEFGISGSLDGETWIVDPIDGTKSFITGYPLFGMLMGYLDGGDPKLGLVRMPALNETYVGIPGQGATLNGDPIQAAKTTELSEASVYINEPDGIRRSHPDLFERIWKIGGTRRAAYDCYPHALVASGQIDICIDFGLQPYDYLPLIGLIEAAGGIMTDWDGNKLTMESEGHVIAAATTELHAAILPYLKR